jgi:hypothetical protein
LRREAEPSAEGEAEGVAGASEDREPPGEDREEAFLREAAELEGGGGGEDGEEGGDGEPGLRVETGETKGDEEGPEMRVDDEAIADDEVAPVEMAAEER